MPILRIDCKHTLVEAMHSGINLFVGAGFSTHARDVKGRRLPTGAELLKELHENVGGGLKDLPRYCSVMERKNKSLLVNYLTERFHVDTFDDCYLSLNRINLKGVYTTNIDDLIPQVIARSTTRYVNEQHVNGDCIDKSNPVAHTLYKICIFKNKQVDRYSLAKL